MKKEIIVIRDKEKRDKKLVKNISKHNKRNVEFLEIFIGKKDNAKNTDEFKIKTFNKEQFFDYILNDKSTNKIIIKIKNHLLNTKNIDNKDLIEDIYLYREEKIMSPLLFMYIENIIIESKNINILALLYNFQREGDVILTSLISPHEKLIEALKQNNGKEQLNMLSRKKV